jgi:hypothetical protein
VIGSSMIPRSISVVLTRPLRCSTGRNAKIRMISETMNGRMNSRITRCCATCGTDLRTKTAIGNPSTKQIATRSRVDIDQEVFEPRGEEEVLIGEAGEPRLHPEHGRSNTLKTTVSAIGSSKEQQHEHRAAVECPFLAGLPRSVSAMRRTGWGMRSPPACHLVTVVEPGPSSGSGGLNPRPPVLIGADVGREHVLPGVARPPHSAPACAPGGV